jgi:K+-sensing histidine kinase KdpD
MIFRSGRQEPGLEDARVAELDGRKESGHYILRLSDEGVGLPQENLESDGSRLFGQTAPCGFGLSVVRFIAQRAGGKLESEARSDCSTCLTFTLQAR